MMQIIQAARDINISGFAERVERGYSVKHENVTYRHVRAPVIVQRPKIEDLNSLVIVHDIVEEYA